MHVLAAAPWYNIAYALPISRVSSVQNGRLANMFHNLDGMETFFTLVILNISKVHRSGAGKLQVLLNTSGLKTEGICCQVYKMGRAAVPSLSANATCAFTRLDRYMTRRASCVLSCKSCSKSSFLIYGTAAHVSARYLPTLISPFCFPFCAPV